MCLHRRHPPHPLALTDRGQGCTLHLSPVGCIVQSCISTCSCCAAGLPAAAAAGDLLHAGYYGRTGLYSSEALMESLDAAEFDKQVQVRWRQLLRRTAGRGSCGGARVAAAGALGSLPRSPSQRCSKRTALPAQVNLRGVVLGTKHAARAMKARGGGGGCIINTTSIAGLEVNCATHGDPAFVAAGGWPASPALLGGAAAMPCCCSSSSSCCWWWSPSHCSMQATRPASTAWWRSPSWRRASWRRTASV